MLAGSTSPVTVKRAVGYAAMALKGLFDQLAGRHRWWQLSLGGEPKLELALDWTRPGQNGC